jgi:biopolymer transport protein ExbD
MGDIAFLLIIFFMVTSNFIKEAHVEIEQASAPDIDVIKESQVSVTMDKDGNLWLQGQPCPVQVLEEGVSALVAEREEKVVMLKIDKDLPNGRFGPVFLALSRAGAEIALVGTPQKD